MDKVLSRFLMEKNMLEDGKVTDSMDGELTFIQTEDLTKVSGRTVN